VDRWANPEDRPNFARRDEFALRRGARRLDDPELAQPVPVPERLPDGPVQLADPRAAPDLGGPHRSHDLLHRPEGRSDEARARRIRQYEDFFNVSGMATPDDLEEFRACQQGYAGQALAWNDMCRGATHWIDGPDDAAKRSA
jgi:benzoate/toluate 1,2-dioxygenase alpha subunit